LACGFDDVPATPRIASRAGLRNQIDQAIYKRDITDKARTNPEPLSLVVHQRLPDLRGFSAFYDEGLLHIGHRQAQSAPPPAPTLDTNAGKVGH
jgi:hypothetical protein